MLNFIIIRDKSEIDVFVIQNAFCILYSVRICARLDLKPNCMRAFPHRHIRSYGRMSHRRRRARASTIELRMLATRRGGAALGHSPAGDTVAPMFLVQVSVHFEQVFEFSSAPKRVV